MVSYPGELGNPEIGAGAPGRVVVIGSSVMDVVGRPQSSAVAASSNPGQVRISPGGVARNVAENLARLGVEVSLMTAVGDDPAGRQLLDQAAQAGINVDHALTVSGAPTGVYLALLTPQGGLQLAIDDMGVVDALTPEYFEARRSVLEGARAIFLDANVPARSLAAVIDWARLANVPVAADPTTVPLAANLRPHLRDLWLVTPNEAEAEALCPRPVRPHKRDRAVDAARQLVAEGVEIALVTMAEFGVGYATVETSGHVPAVQTEVLDPTGAGDAQTAAVLFGLLNGIPLDESVRLGISAAALTLRTSGSVVPNLSLELLYDVLR